MKELQKASFKLHKVGKKETKAKEVKAGDSEHKAKDNKDKGKEHKKEEKSTEKSVENKSKSKEKQDKPIKTEQIKAETKEGKQVTKETKDHKEGKDTTKIIEKPIDSKENIIAAKEGQTPISQESTIDSQENTKAKLKEKMKSLVEEQKKAGERWGKTFNEECFRFEREWKKLVDTDDEKHAKVFSEELNETSKAKVDYLVKKLLAFNIFEMRYMSCRLKERIKRGVGINPLKLNIDWPSAKAAVDAGWGPLNPNWFKQQEIMAKLGPFLATLMPKATPVQQVVEKPKEEPKPATPAEAKPKESPKPIDPTGFVDIEMTSYADASKIRVIKEYRAIVGLGLKEAKEKVEKVPFIAFKRLKRDEAEEIVKKFEGYGAKMKLL